MQTHFCFLMGCNKSRKLQQFLVCEKRWIWVQFTHLPVILLSVCGMLSTNHVTQSSCKASAVRTWWALPGAALQFVVYSLIEFSTIHVSANYAYSAVWLLVCPLLQALQRPYFRLASAPAGSTGLLAPVYLVLPGCWPQPLVYLLCFILGKISEFWYHFYFSEKLQELCE